MLSCVPPNSAGVLGALAACLGSCLLLLLLFPPFACSTRPPLARRNKKNLLPFLVDSGEVCVRVRVPFLVSQSVGVLLSDVVSFFPSFRGVLFQRGRRRRRKACLPAQIANAVKWSSSFLQLPLLQCFVKKGVEGNGFTKNKRGCKLFRLFNPLLTLPACCCNSWPLFRSSSSFFVFSGLD